MKIGIMCATRQELDPLLARLQNKRTTERLMRSFVTGEYAGLTVTAVIGGVGKVNGAITAQELITGFGAEKIIFTGLAGGLDETVLELDRIFLEGLEGLSLELKKGEAGGVAPLGEDGKVPNDYINAQGGLVAQEEPPENTTLGWIDTANGNILKFYRDGDWISVSAVWG